MEKVSYLGQPNCFKLTNGSVEVIVSTDIGPRVLRYGFCGGDNLFAEVPELVTRTQLGEWKPWGGHRLWTAPELMPGSYAPDNEPIQYQQRPDNSIELHQPVDKAGMQKTMRIQLADSGTRIEVLHRITNQNAWPIRVAAWASTIMRGGGRTVLPQEPFQPHDQCLRAARAVVLLYFTSLTDPRWSIGARYICLHTDQQRPEPQKIGISNQQKWCGYLLDNTLFVKRFDYVPGAEYPDFGSNNETYTMRNYMEVESLGPLHTLKPGESAEHLEEWHLFKNVNAGENESSLHAAIGPLIAELSPTPEEDVQ